MASLVEELINVLTEEEKYTEHSLQSGEKKRQIIIDADIPALEALTDLDQQAGDELLIMSNKLGFTSHRYCQCTGQIR